MPKNICKLLCLLISSLIVFGLFILHFSSPFQESQNKKIAIVNNDKLVKIDKKEVLMGRQLASKLVDNSSSNYNFVLTNYSDSQDGIKSGEYIASIIIPSEFSKVIASYKNPKKIKPITLQVTISEDAKVLDNIYIQNVINSKVYEFGGENSKLYLENLYLGYNTLSNGIQMISKGMTALDKGMEGLNKGAGALSQAGHGLITGIEAFNKGADGLGKGSDGISKGANGLNSAAGPLKKGASGLSQGGQQLLNGYSQFDNGLSTLNNMSSYMSADQLRNAISGLASASSSIKTGISSYTGGVSSFANGLNKYIEGVSTFGTGVSSFANGVSKFSSGAVQLNNGVIQYVKGVNQFSSAIPQVSKGFKQLNKGLSSLSSSTSTYSKDEISNLSSSVASPIKKVNYTNQNENYRYVWIFVLTLWTTIFIVTLFKNSEARFLNLSKTVQWTILSSLKQSLIFGEISTIVISLLSLIYIGKDQSSFISTIVFGIFICPIFLIFQYTIVRAFRKSISYFIVSLFILLDIMNNLIQIPSNIVNTLLAISPIKLGEKTLSSFLFENKFDLLSSLSLLVYSFICIIVLNQVVKQSKFKSGINNG